MKARKEHVALTKCYFCNEDNEILLARTYTHNGEPLHDLAPYHGKVASMTPCNKCEGYMKQGVILLTIDAEKSGPNWNKPPVGAEKGWMPNPYRTGGFFVVRDEAIKRMFDSMADWAIKHRWMFIEHEAAEKLGFFKQENNTDESNS